MSPLNSERQFVQDTISAALTADFAPENMRIAAIVFDVDGTLYDQRFVRRKMAVEVISAHLLRPMRGLALFRFLTSYRKAQETLRGSELYGRAGEAQLRAACERSHTDAAAARSYLEEWFHTAPLRYVRAALRPGTVEFLSAVRSRGVRLGVLSDYPASSKLEVLGLASYFDTVVSSYDADVRGFKPDPSGLLLVAKRLGVAPQRLLYVGDRPVVDAECARRAGASAAILEIRGRRYPKAETCWHSVPSLASLLGELQTRGLLP
jgi:putative hydrolase of the HAD superfamily